MVKLELHYVVTFSNGRVSRFWAPLDYKVTQLPMYIASVVVDAVRTTEQQITTRVDERPPRGLEVKIQ